MIDKGSFVKLVSKSLGTKHWDGSVFEVLSIDPNGKVYCKCTSGCIVGHAEWLYEDSAEYCLKLNSDWDE